MHTHVFIRVQTTSLCVCVCEGRGRRFHGARLVPRHSPGVGGMSLKLPSPARPRTPLGGKSRGRGAPATPSLGFPKGELGLNNESI